MVVNLFDYFLSDASEAPAIYFGDDVLSYARLRELTVETAKRFVAAGLQPGDRVGLVLFDSPEFIASFLAASGLGAIAVPINPALGAGDISFILGDCAARGLVIESTLVSELASSLETLPHLQWVMVVRAERESVPRIRGKTAVDFSTARRDELPGSFPHPVSKDTPAFLLYTSGSTGQPKGAIHAHGDIPYTVETYCRHVLDIKPEDRIFSASKLPFAYGLGNSLSFPLASRASVILYPGKPTPEAIQDIFARYRPTVFFGVPVVYNALLAFHRQGGRLDVSSLRLCVSAGEALPASVSQAWMETFGREILDGIGSTEMLHIFISNRVGQVRHGSSGFPVPGYEVRLIDDEGRPVEIGQQGHLWVRGESAARGYWQRPDITARTFVQGWVRTGDMYRCDPQGYYYHIGRSDDCFKVSGQWVSPLEIEDVLRRHECVQDVAIIEGKTEEGFSCVKAIVVPTGNIDPDRLKDELLDLAEKSLPRFKRPKIVEFVADLPRTPTGKVQRFKLRQAG